MARVAFIVDDLFEDSEFRIPYDRVRRAGHQTVIIGRHAGKELKGMKGQERIVTDQAVKDVAAVEFDALMIPGGYSPDRLRTDEHVVRFVRQFDEAGKPVAAICHAGWLLAEADIVRGRTLTSWPSIRTDLINAGALWVDRQVVVDGNVITSRKPEDLDAFCSVLLMQLQPDHLTHPRGVTPPSGLH